MERPIKCWLEVTTHRARPLKMVKRNRNALRGAGRGATAHTLTHRAHRTYFRRVPPKIPPRVSYTHFSTGSSVKQEQDQGLKVKLRPQGTGGPSLAASETPRGHMGERHVSLIG